MKPNPKIEDEETLEYMVGMLVELHELAQRSNHKLLAYCLSMALLECGEHLPKPEITTSFRTELCQA